MNGFEQVDKLAMNSHPAESVADATREPAVLEPKYDGIRLLVNVRDDGVFLYARSGKQKTGKLPAVEAELATLPAGTWLDGEAVAFNEDGTQNWGGAQSVLGSTVSRARLISGGIRFVIFDILAYDNMDARSLPFRQRRELLELIFDEPYTFLQLSVQQPATDESHELNLELGYEGSMVKHLEAPYQSGRRSRRSLKLKATDTVDAVITGFKPAMSDSWIAKSGLIGAIEFKHYENGVEVAGRCSGMTVQERELITANQKHLVGGVIEVSYMTRMPGGKLRHPQFKRLRNDKTAEECRR